MVLPSKAPRRIASAVLNSLKGGVVPRIGLPWVTVGRRREIESLLSDIALVRDGGATFRFVVGRYGSGKSFLLQAVRTYAMERNFVVCDADLSPERRLSGGDGQGLATYRELMGNLATRTRPEGGALPLVLDRWLDAVRTQTAEETGLAPDSPLFAGAVEERIRETVSSLRDLVGGFDFALLLSAYCRADAAGDDDAKARVVKWFRGEYATRTEARRELGVGSIPTDENWYDHLKLFAAFFRRAGYEGLLVLFDELVNLSKIPNAVARERNYEKILTMYNDALQGKAKWLGTILCGTPQCLEDRRRGLFGYEALRSRLESGKFSREGLRDLMGPVIRLEPLAGEEMLVLCEKLLALHATLHGYEPKLREEDLARFLRHEYARIGADASITPREVIRDFIELADLLLQYPDRTPGELLAGGDFPYAESQEKTGTPGGAGEFAEFTL
jgi:hypothetical protein